MNTYFRIQMAIINEVLQSKLKLYVSIDYELFI